ncbi:DUF4335 domain-containing protein [Gloeocapsa sp. PCC 73106]|uniref:DUF4335 domain-containing protein n=1 Tax=Gloeocapsa sp. PCC 73106 TaxID=102232 RepID=UPI0002ACC00A|nr:DUF4335 domain-containing protein [Gloeocapsa sp. PCC 73106]ELR97954.1 hypothetical protein GLO73106DRAFT_00017730 [Gloeocapsa sp. PCC 73106]
MNIRRQYQSSNCTLVLEGLSNDANDFNHLAILLSAECHLIGSRQTLSGGRIFLENLARVVNAYTQDLLSGLPHPQPNNLESDIIHIQPYGNFHRLTWQKNQESGPEVTQVDLTTVQLFDLVETIDQLLADEYTLPDLTLPIEPLSRRHKQDNEALLERSLPAIVGIGTLALTAIAAFFLEPPVVREPRPQPLDNSTETIPTPETAPQPR